MIDLAGLAWDFDLDQQARRADRLADWLTARSIPLADRAVLRALLRCGCAARGFDWSWLSRECNDSELDLNRVDVRSVLSSLFYDEVAAGRASTWKNYESWGFSALDLSLRDVEDAFALGQIVGNKFQIVERIGSGGFGTVYGAVALADGFSVAIKAPRRAENAAAAARYCQHLRSESETLRALSCTGIPRWLDEAEEGGLPFFAMQRIEGIPLSQHVSPSGIPETSALELTAQIARILDAAHQRGFLHGDLKAANIHLTASGKAYLLDFGVARSADPRLARDGRLPGTIPFMSPESLVGIAADTDVRQDIWALGALLYELVTGKTLHAAANRESALVAAVLTGGIHGIEFDKPISDPTQQIIQIATSRQALLRWETAGDFSNACECVLLGETIELPPSRTLTAWRLGVEFARLEHYQQQVGQMLSGSMSDRAAGVMSAMGVATSHESVACLAERLKIDLPDWPHADTYRLWFYRAVKQSVVNPEPVITDTTSWLGAALQLVAKHLEGDAAHGLQMFQFGYLCRTAERSESARMELQNLLQSETWQDRELATFVTQISHASLQAEDWDLAGVEFNVQRHLRWHHTRPSI